MAFTVRPATADDAERIYEINRDALGYEDAPESTRRRLQSIIARATDRVFVICRDADGFLVGVLHTADYDVIYMDSMKNIISLAIDLAFQGQGLGRRLLNAAEDWAHACGCAAVRLVSGENRTGAHAFYQHCGYSLRKAQKNFIKYL